MAQKTKATMPGRQCSTENKEPNQHTRPVAGGQSVSTMYFCILGTAPMAQLNHNMLISKQSSNLSLAALVSSKIVGCVLITRQLGGTALQHTQYFPQWGECEPVAGTLILRTSLGGVQILPLCSPVLGRSNIGYQPFGSMPRDCSSFRKTRFIQVAREESPSFFISASSCARNSCWRRIWYWSVLVLALDIVITKSILSAGGCNYNVTKMVLQLLNMTKPCSARTLTGPLTKPLIGVTVMADKQHTQTHPKFTWLFLGIPKGQTCTPVVIRIAADTEKEAREWYYRWDLTFAAKIRSECPLYQHINGAYELTITGLEVRHA